ncbi:MAG: hypothetical protein IJU01_04545 [Lachnospiraceae bacterium]|nr:hypothetical protein [Lachnospiraceae bacterium]
MRNYKAKADKYKLPKVKADFLKAACTERDPDGRIILETDIKAVLKEMFAEDDVIKNWLFEYVTSKRPSWKQIYLRGVPCGKETFRIYRYRFYWLLDRRLSGASF